MTIDVALAIDAASNAISSRCCIGMVNLIQHLHNTGIRHQISFASAADALSLFSAHPAKTHLVIVDGTLPLDATRIMRLLTSNMDLCVASTDQDLDTSQLLTHAMRHGAHTDPRAYAEIPHATSERVGDFVRVDDVTKTATICVRRTAAAGTDRDSLLASWTAAGGRIWCLDARPLIQPFGPAPNINAGLQAWKRLV